MVSTISSTDDRPENQNDFLDFFDKYGYVGPFTLSDTSMTGKIMSAWRSPFFNKSTKLHNTKRDLHVYSRILFEQASTPDIINKLNLMLGLDLFVWTEHVINRPPGNPGQDWHIDQDNYEVDGIHATIALTDMNQTNGCLKVIPGSHKYGITNDDLNDFARKGMVDLSDSQSVADLADKLFPNNAPHPVVPVETKPNQYFFTKGGLWHGVSLNKSNTVRSAMVARYMRTDKDGTNVSWYDAKTLPCVLVSGENSDNPNDIYQPPIGLLRNFIGLNYWINYLLRKMSK